MDSSGNSLYAQVFDVDFNQAVFNKVVAMEKKIDEMYAIISTLRRKTKKINTTN